MAELKVAKELEDIFDNYNAFVGKTYDREGKVRTKFCLSGDGYDYDFEIWHDGTEESFIHGLIESLESFEGTEYFKDVVNQYDPANLDDVDWYLTQARELEENCENLHDDLLDYAEEREEA